MFERTIAGQQNRALFYGANYTCYIEGDTSNSRDSRDGTFWKKIFKAFRPDLRVAFLPRGGKPILETLARDIKAHNIANTLVAMDADYDRLTNDLIDDERVLYTYGYSWENDVFHHDLIAGIVSAILHKESLSDAARVSLASHYASLVEQSRRAIVGDALALVAGSSVLPRNAPGRVFKVEAGTGKVIVDRKELLKLLGEANRRTKPRSKSLPSPVEDGVRYLVGHCLAHCASVMIRALLLELGLRKSLSADHLKDIAVYTLDEILQKNPESVLSRFHQAQCAAVPG